MFSLFLVPLDGDNRWELLKFSNLPENKTVFTGKEMKISVQSSASPIIYPFFEAKKVKKVTVRGRLNGRIQLNNKTQGESGADDFELRLGLVLAGNKKLNRFQKFIAADWIKRLHNLVPVNSRSNIGPNSGSDNGIDKIFFLNAVQDKQKVGTSRVHPLSDLIMETYAWHMEREGNFDFSYLFDKEVKAVALWLSIDGDDTKSNFEVIIKNIIINDHET